MCEATKIRGRFVEQMANKIGETWWAGVVASVVFGKCSPQRAAGLHCAFCKVRHAGAVQKAPHG